MEEEESCCRVCHGESEPTRPLFYPCKCTGTIKFVHQDCLLEWIKVSKQVEPKCELCGERFSFQRVYASDAPAYLSVSEFVFALVHKLFNKIYEMTRYVILFSILFGMIPLFLSSSCLLYIFFLLTSDIELRLIFHDSSSLKDSIQLYISLWWHGIMLGGFAMIILVVILQFFEFISNVSSPFYLSFIVFIVIFAFSFH